MVPGSSFGRCGHGRSSHKEKDRREDHRGAVGQAVPAGKLLKAEGIELSPEQRAGQQQNRAQGALQVQSLHSGG